MSDAEQIRTRAARLFALALKARDEGNLYFADEITKLASEAFDQATEMERRPGATPIAPATQAPQQVAQQQQQPQPDDPKKKE
jgi:hypothetical protein